ncbi:alpha/beta hydrolase [Halorussus salinus]|uniref:alpha/beta hydrolase n=1 Tax=Halorussus salinus TaxID=1364935 RepID=UPI001092AD8D|nr:alpha/beta fold hydrolase [Halorussus salinus]
MTRLDRRNVLTAVGTGLTALLAGCQGAGDATDTTASTETSTPATTTPSETTTTDETTSDASDPEELRRRAKEFVGLLADGSFEEAHGRFDANMADQLSVQQLQQVWSGLKSQIGSFSTLTALEVGSENGYDVVTGIAEFDRGRREVILYFGGDAIAGFRIQRVTEEWTSPAYADQSSFTERSVSLSATDACTLEGTLTLPNGVERAPGVLLVHGSGPIDRDGTFGPNKVYKDLAWGLASRGVAVLRYDKRTAACDVNLAEITIDEVVTNDALTAVEELRKTDLVTDDDVVVAGHSLGGTLAPRIAARDGNLAGVVMLAPLARSASDAIIDQNRYLAELDGTVTDAEEEQLNRSRRIAEQIRSLDFPDDEVVHLGGDEYWRTLAEYDHLQTASDLAIPRLLLFGERDYQVTVEEDLPRWRDALDGESNATLRRYDRLNHLFMPGSGKPNAEEYFERNHVAERVVTDFAAFVGDATGVEVGVGGTATTGADSTGTTTE